mgnify:CR=1 FL=1
MKYRPRNDYVVLRLHNMDKTPAGVVIPKANAEGRVWTVVATGPKVEDLKVGDVVNPMGEVGQDIALLPRERDLYITREGNILMVQETEYDDG